MSVITLRPIIEVVFKVFTALIITVTAFRPLLYSIALLCYIQGRAHSSSLCSNTHLEPTVGVRVLFHDRTINFQILAPAFLFTLTCRKRINSLIDFLVVFTFKPPCFLICCFMLSTLVLCACSHVHKQIQPVQEQSHFLFTTQSMQHNIMLQSR